MKHTNSLYNEYISPNKNDYKFYIKSLPFILKVNTVDKYNKIGYSISFDEIYNGTVKTLIVNALIYFFKNNNIGQIIDNKFGIVTSLSNISSRDDYVNIINKFAIDSISQYVKSNN